MKDLLPQRLIPVVLDQAYLDEEKPVNQISKEERKRLVEVLKGLSVSITGTRPLAEAIVTAGGVSIKEIELKHCVPSCGKDCILQEKSLI